MPNMYEIEEENSGPFFIQSIDLRIWLADEP